MLFGAKAIEYAPFGRMKRVYERVKNIRRLCIEIVEARKRNPIQTVDLLSSLINTQKSDDLNMRYSDVDIVNEFIFFAVAGMDTTGHLIGMSLYNLTQYPQYQKDLKEERDRTFNTEKNVTIETLGKMDVLHSVLKESLRFYTPAASLLFREVKEDHEILDLKLKKGMLVTGEMMAMYFNEKYFKNPEEFDP
jgi:cytochrome P450